MKKVRKRTIILNTKTMFNHLLVVEHLFAAGYLVVKKVMMGNLSFITVVY